MIRDRRCPVNAGPAQTQIFADDGGIGRAIVVCGDKILKGYRSSYMQIAAATQNMQLSIHGLGLEGVWCGVAPNSGIGENCASIN